MAGAQGRRSVRAEFYCGALTRKKRRCRVYKLRGRKRCKFHAGLSTGPRTEAGKARVAEAQRKAWAKLKAEMGLPEGWMSTARFVSKGRRKREAHTAAAYLAEHGPRKPEDEKS
jgi:hypothetical protein